MKPGGWEQCRSPSESKFRVAWKAFLSYDVAASLGEILAGLAAMQPSTRERMMASKGIGVKECPEHGEYYLDAVDSPCPSCEEECEESNLG